MAWVVLRQVAAGDWRRKVLEGLDWVWEEGESWVVTGPNGSGKSALAALLVGRLDAVTGERTLHRTFAQAEEAWIGFERQRLLLEWERHIDLTDVSESPDPGTLTADFVGDEALLARFGLEGKGNRGLKHLSTGELRRACLARAWRLHLPFLLLDEPFEGLDKDGVALLTSRLSEARRSGTDQLLLTRKPSDRPEGEWRLWTLSGAAAPLAPVARFLGPPRRGGQPVLEFHNVTAGYRDLTVLAGLDWTVQKGDRWLITGPNGSGKSTLLSLISGDHPQVFSNDIRILGRRRGSELTLAQVRQTVGLVSYASHLTFRNLFGVTGLEVLVSGFAGTIGLWTDPSWDQVEAARALSAEWGLTEAVARLWEDLSWGTQRLILLARVLVAGCPILLLDEPCQGLDPVAQAHVLERVSSWAENPDHTLVYVTHRGDEVDPDAFLRLTLPQGRS